jgi:predicted RNA-binding protein YlxR (DUF448 family)/ribosomal protein L7Ae-like RNA K-turn-binding protein
MQQRSESRRSASTRTCVGCGLRDDALATLRLVVAEGQVVFDLAGGSFGRGAHVHASAACIAKAPRALARAFHCQGLAITPAELGEQLLAACDRRMVGLLLSARRTRTLAVGTNAAMDAIERASLVIVAVDAGRVASSSEVEHAAGSGRVVAWKTKKELGALLGEETVAICAVCHVGIAAELKTLRAAADAGAAATREGAGCSRRPEAR